MITFSGNNASRLALNVLQSTQKVALVTRSENFSGKEQIFLERVRNTLERAKLLSDIVRKEMKQLDPQGPLAEYHSLLLKLEHQTIDMKEILINTIRIAKKGLSNPETVSTVLNISVNNLGRAIKDFIITAKEVEYIYPKDNCFIIDSVIHGPFISEFPFSEETVDFLELPNYSVKNQTEKIKKESENWMKYQTATIHHPYLDPQGEALKRKISRSEGKSGPSAEGGDIASKIQYGIELFNQKWKNGINYLISERIIKEDTNSIAVFLIQHNEKLSSAQVGEILAGSEDDTVLLSVFTNLMNFKGDSFDQALRKYLTKFMLPGEAQKISRIMEVFAAEYFEQNPEVFPNKDVAFVLAFSLIMLNTDAHNPAIAAKDKMSKEEYIRNNRGTWENGQDPPRELLEEFYDKIVNDEIKIQTKGDPDKKGWLKAIHGGSIREGRRWFVLVGNELRWYKSPFIGKANEEMRGKIVLEYVQVREEAENCKFYIQSVLPNKNISFFSYEREKDGKEIECKRFVISAENEKQMTAWATAIRENVSFENMNILDPSSKTAPKLKHRNKQENKKKNAWRNSFASTGNQVGTIHSLGQHKHKKKHIIKVTSADRNSTPGNNL